MRKRILAWGMTLCMIFTMTPMTALATETGHTHAWSSEWSGNYWFHWHDCTAADCELSANMGEGKEGFGYHEFDLAGSTHDYYPNSTQAVHKGTCVTCGETEAVKSFETVTMKYDETHHWRECTCGHIEESKSEHTYTDDADTTCDCGYPRTVAGVITLTPANLVEGVSGEGWRMEYDQLHISEGYTLHFQGTCDKDVDNYGTIAGGTYSGVVNNQGTISGGVFTGGMTNPGTATVTGTADLSGLNGLDNRWGGQYGKDVKLPKAMIRGNLTYTGCDPSTEITLHYYADDVKTAEWKVSGSKYSYPVEKYKRTNPDADISTIAEIVHNVTAVPMDGYEITIENPIENPIWDRFHVSVTANSLPHQHDFSSAWGHNDTHHWRECVNADCNETDNSQKGSYEEHSYTNGVCECGKTKPSSGSSGSSSSSSKKLRVPISGEDETIRVEVSVKGDKATVRSFDVSRLDDVIGDHVDEIGTVTIDFSDLNSKKTITTVEIPAEVVEEIAEAVNDPDNDAHSFTVILSDGTSIEFDGDALEEKVKQADDHDITISIRNHEDVTLTDEQMETVGDRMALDISVTSGGEHISDMGGKVTVHAPYELKKGEKAEGIVVYYVDEDGDKERCVTSYDERKELVNWKTDHLSLYMIAYEEPEVPVVPAENPFVDVTETDWFYRAVMFVSENGLMSGTDTGVFSPAGKTTRGMIVTILHRMEGRPDAGTVPFADVNADMYYAEAIAWAAENSIVSGYGDTFGPDDHITREQLASILWRYAKYKGYDVSVGENTNILSYEDAFDISEYAIPAMQWACGEGIISGNDDGTLNPKGHAQRSHAAQMLMKFNEDVK